MLGHIGLPSEKETRFFDVRYDRGAKWYCDLFGDYPADVPGGEMGPTYFSNAISRPTPTSARNGSAITS